MLQSQAVMPDPERLLDAFVSPALILGVGLLVAVVTPLIEETDQVLRFMDGRPTLLGRLSRAARRLALASSQGSGSVSPRRCSTAVRGCRRPGPTLSCCVAAPP